MSTVTKTPKIICYIIKTKQLKLLFLITGGWLIGLNTDSNTLKLNSELAFLNAKNKSWL